MAVQQRLKDVERLDPHRDQYWLIFARKGSSCVVCREPIQKPTAVYRHSDGGPTCHRCAKQLGVRARESKGYKRKLAEQGVTVRHTHPDPGRMVEREQTRDRVRSVVCPQCGAGVGERCVRRDGSPRKSNHQQRVEAWTLPPF